MTGATGQLGRAMVRTFARAGADVVVHFHRDRAMADRLAAEATALGVRSVAVQADVTSRDSVVAMRGSLPAQPDILVNNAVIQYDWKNILDQAPEDFESQFRSSVLHSVFMAKAFLPAMIAKRWGRIIGINTDLAIRALPGQGAYVAGKRGMDGVLRVLAREAGPHGVTVNQVAPGWMISDNQRAAGAVDQPAYAANIPLARRGDDQDVANAVAFLASDLAGFVTGAFFPVCGGYALPMI